MKKIKIACIGNYVPRQCGIATFTRDLVESLIHNSGIGGCEVEAFVVAMNDHDFNYDYPGIVKFQVRESRQRDYLHAARFIDYSDADFCILQHEYGIFGGENGLYLLPLLRRLKKPLIATLHTVLKNPSYNQRTIVREIAKRAEKLVVMSERAVDFLNDSYGIDREKVAVIEHGVPDFNFTDRASFKKKLNLTGKKSLLTFGLLSRDKGIETVIDALPKVVARHPEVLYIVLGKTHPAVIRASGDKYRNYLKFLVEKNKLRNHVHFLNRYVGNEELFHYLAAIDIYITPYLNKAQITSGTLAYAIGAGSAVVSTRYWHARELLAHGRGRLFNFGNSDALTGILNELLSEPAKLEKMRLKAYEFGRKTLWPEIGRRYIDLISNSLADWAGPAPEVETVIDPLALPDFHLTHIKKLTDDTGIFQHANYIFPNFKEGYCLDDNARALLVCTMAYRQKKLTEALDLMHRFISFVHYMQNENGTFRNHLNFRREYLDETGSEDCFGRTIWALGYLLRFAPNDSYFQLARDIFFKAYPHFENLKDLRGTSFTIIGISHYLHHAPADAGMFRALETLTNRVVEMYEKEKGDDWQWFESKITYANGIIPLALLHSYEITKDEKTLEVAKETMDFLKKLTLKQGYLVPVGSDNWYERGGEPARFAQQSIEAMAMVSMYYQAYFVTGDAEYTRLMSSCFMWFLGDNEMGIPLYDFETHGCCDGLESHGVSNNQGAESTLAYYIAHLTVLLALE